VTLPVGSLVSKFPIVLYNGGEEKLTLWPSGPASRGICPVHTWDRDVRPGSAHHEPEPSDVGERAEAVRYPEGRIETLATGKRPCCFAKIGVFARFQLELARSCPIRRSRFIT